jgi:hypothetical protein
MGHTSRVAFGLCVLFTVLAAGAAAQGPTPPTPTTAIQDVKVLPGDMLITDNETWNTSHNVSGILFIRHNASLTLEGATLRVGTLDVEPGGKLTLLSTPDASAVVEPSNVTGWQGVIVGDLEIRGAPGHPVVLTGIGGQSRRLGTDQVFFQSGLYLSGNVSATDLEVSDYASGVFLTHSAHLEADALSFRSPTGTGLIVGLATAHVRDATFQGRGAGMFVTRDGRMALANASFQDTDTAIVTSGIHTQLEGMTIRNATFCIEQYGGALEVQDMSCQKFLREGIYSSLVAPNLKATIDITNVSVSDPRDAAAPGEGHGVHLVGLTSANITDADLGPLPGDGLVEERTAPNLSGISIHDVGIFNEILYDPPNSYQLVPHFNGTSGLAGRLEVKFTVLPTVLLPNGSPAANASVAYYQNASSPAPFKAQLTNDTGVGTDGPTLLGWTILPNGSRAQFAYVVRAKTADGVDQATQLLTLKTSGEFTLTLAEVAQAVATAHGVPALGAPAMIAALALLSLAMRGHRPR